MAHLLVWFVLITQYPLDETILDALSEKTNGNLLQAEGILLRMEPDDANLGRVAYPLCELALQIGTVDEKLSFYESLLFEGRTQRGIALYVLAGLHISANQFDQFQTRAATFLKEYPGDRSIERYRLLYHLARFTPVAQDELDLSQIESAWFVACRDLKEDRVFPILPTERLPFPLGFLHHLESGDPFDLPARPKDDTTFESDYFYQLLTLKHALNQQKDNEAAEIANAIIRIDRRELRFDHRIWWYTLLMELHESREDQVRASQANERREKLKAYAVLPFKSIPEAQRQRVETLSTPQVEEEEKAPEPVDVVVKVQDGTVTVGQVDVRHRFEKIEKALHLGQPTDVEAALKSLNVDTRYDRIYAEYLRGLSFLRSGRYTSSFKKLTAAEKEVQDLPFPVLESKILLAIGDTYEKEGNDQQAEWYRIAAAQIWSESTIVPLLDNDEAQRNPYLFLLDQNLQQATHKDVVSGLIYHNEMNHFTGVRQKAYRRACLSTNSIINNQILEMGKHLATIVSEVSHGEGQLPSQYNETLEVWQQLWNRVLPFYRQCNTPSVSDIQRLLSRTDRAVALIEGHRLLGVVIISKTNAFCIGLGAKKEFRKMDAEGQLAFLEHRIGPIFQQTGKLWITASPIFRNTEFIRKIQADNGNRTRWIFSFRSLFPENETTTCLGTVVFSRESKGAVYDYVQSLPRTGLDWFAENAVSKSQMTKNVPHHAHFVFQGSISQTPEGLLLGEEDQAFYVHDLFMKNHQLCSLTLVSDDFSDWGAIFEEIELINVESPITIRLGRSLGLHSPHIPIPNQTFVRFQ